MVKFVRISIVGCSLMLGLPLAIAQATDAHPSPQEPPASPYKVQVLSVSQMAPADAQVLQTRRSDLNTAVKFHGYDMGSGTWIQSQVVCPYAPHYVIMHNVQLHHDGLISLFTALIPRAGGQVRIIPVLHHGAQALPILGASPTQVSLVDQVISAREVSEVPNQNGDWVTLAYCYGALAGAEPVAPSATAPEETVPRVALHPNGTVREMSFSVLGPDHFYQDWSIQFGGRGQVKSITLLTRVLNPPQEVPDLALPRARRVPDAPPSKVNSIPSPQ
jgi:hypothetical protein